MFGIALLLATFGIGFLVAWMTVPTYVPAVYGGIAGFCWGWMIARAPRRRVSLPRQRRLLGWEIFLVLLAGAGAVLLLGLSQPGPGDRWWLFIATLALVYNLISALFRHLRIRLLSDSDDNEE